MSYLVVAGRARPPIAQTEMDASAWAAHHDVAADELYGDCICSPNRCRDTTDGFEPVCASCAHQPPDRLCRAA